MLKRSGFIKTSTRSSTYCSSPEFVLVPEPYRTLIKVLTQNSQKQLDRNLRVIFFLIE